MLLRFRPVLCLLLLASAAPAAAQRINRCTDANGATVYSDRSCEALGAVNRLPSAPPAGAAGLYRDGCTRRLSELVWQIRTAVDARDVNQLSGIYLWNGLSDAAASRVLDRLEAIVQRPLVDIAPVYAEAAPVAPVADPLAPAVGSSVPAGETVSAPSARRRPIGLRLEQVMANGSTPSRTVLGLRRQYNCFWISL